MNSKTRLTISFSCFGCTFLSSSPNGEAKHETTQLKCRRGWDDGPDDTAPTTAIQTFALRQAKCRDNEHFLYHNDSRRLIHKIQGDGIVAQ